MALPYKKGDDENLWYGIDWTDWLPESNGISTSDWVVPDGLTQEDTGVSAVGTTIKLSGGTVGTTYEITNIITTDTTGEEAERTIRVKIVEKKYE